MKSIKTAIPSLITCTAILLGCISIVQSVHHNLVMAGYLIIAAAVLDFFDGMFARMLNAITPFGKQMDSLADAVNFGVAPAMILFRLTESALDAGPATGKFAMLIFTYLPFIIVIFAVLRLAKFNIDETQAKSFSGLPSPANALFVAALGVATESTRFLFIQRLTENLWFIIFTIILLSFLMVANFKMFSLKFENYAIRKNILRYIMLAASLVILLIFGIPGIVPVIILYILLSAVNNIFAG
ncbi:MAG: CDP-diacylglycerol--serine O-phosphatidyltransferase [Bacteroidales bacterium]|nr:CDP-diacylglycerol--serine O-phosphatidyltransferase [Bacteroidales bacterium]